MMIFYLCHEQSEKIWTFSIDIGSREFDQLMNDDEWSKFVQDIESKFGVLDSSGFGYPDDDDGSLDFSGYSSYEINVKEFPDVIEAFRSKFSKHWVLSQVKTCRGEDALTRLFPRGVKHHLSVVRS